MNFFTVLFVCLFETETLYIALAVLEYTEIFLTQPLSAGITVERHPANFLHCIQSTPLNV